MSRQWEAFNFHIPGAKASLWVNILKHPGKVKYYILFLSNDLSQLLHIPFQKIDLTKDRPDFSDFEALTDFSNKIARKILSNHEFRFLKAKPVTDMDKCNNCGLCAGKCPMGSISADNVADVSGICIKCQACVKFCPTHAKYFTDADFLSHVEMLENTYTDRKEAKFLF